MRDATKNGKPDESRPKPPSAAQVDQLVEGAFEDDYALGMLVLLTTTTGLRLPELLARRFEHIDFGDLAVDTDERGGTMLLDGSYDVRPVKGPELRRIALGSSALSGFARLWDQYAERMKQLQLDPDRSAFVFSYAPDNTSPSNPKEVRDRFGQLCTRLGIKWPLHALRHYSAADAITARPKPQPDRGLPGVDIRAVSDRLGHNGGRTVKLRE